MLDGRSAAVHRCADPKDEHCQGNEGQNELDVLAVDLVQLEQFVIHCVSPLDQISVIRIHPPRLQTRLQKIRLFDF